MHLYQIKEDYLDEIRKASDYIPKQEETIGYILRLSEYIYFLPIQNEDENDYEADGSIIKSSPFLLRMISSDNKKCLGKCLFSNMFPVPYSELITFDLNNISSHFVPFYEKKIEYLKKNKSRIEKAAKRIYSTKSRKYRYTTRIIREKGQFILN